MKNVGDDAWILNLRGVLGVFAGRLVSTGKKRAWRTSLQALKR
jgi:hypothetical protein